MGPNLCSCMILTFIHHKMSLAARLDPKWCELCQMCSKAGLAKTHVSVALGYHPSTMPVILKMCSQSYSRRSGSIIKFQFFHCCWVETDPDTYPCFTLFWFNILELPHLRGTKPALPSHLYMIGKSLVGPM